MTLPARRPGRSFLILGAAAALFTAGTLAVAQQPQAAPAPAAGAAPAATPAKPAKPAAEPSAAKPAKAEGDKAATSYSLGVIMGAQLRKAGVHPADISSERLTAGFRDALYGKATLGQNDQANLTKLLHGAYDASVDTNHRAAAKFLAENGKKPGVITTASGLEYKVITPGSGDSPKPSDEATVNYRGSLLDGTEFDSSYKRGKPATFGVGQRDPGLDRGAAADEAGLQVPAVDSAAARLRCAAAAGRAHSAGRDAGVRRRAHQREGTGAARQPRLP